MLRQSTNSNRQFFCGLTSLLLLIAASVPSLRAADKIDKEEIKRKVHEDLERQRREAAERELERLRERRRDTKSQLEYARRWARLYYGLDEAGVIRRPQQVSAVMQRHEQQKELMKFRLLEQRERFRGAIAKGTALNFFLQECGAVAFDHKFYREIAPADDAQRTLEQTLLQQVSAKYVLDEDTTRHIRYQRGLTGSKLTGRLNSGPLDLEWPSVLRQEHYDGLRKSIEQQRDRIVEQLQNRQPVDAKSADALLGSVQELVKRVRSETLRQVPKARGNYQSIQRNYAAERFCQVLVAGSYRLIEARDARDILVEPFDHGNIEDLMAFMYRNNLTFAESDANGESVYNMLYEMMARYFVDLQSLRLAIRETISDAEQELQKLDDMKHEEQVLREIALGERLSNEQQVEMARINGEIAKLKAENTGKWLEVGIAGLNAIAENQRKKAAQEENKRDKVTIIVK